MLVIFGGVTGYSSDDINKFLWPVRIGSGVFPDDMHHEKVGMRDGVVCGTFRNGTVQHELHHGKVPGYGVRHKMIYGIVCGTVPHGMHHGKVPYGMRNEMILCTLRAGTVWRTVRNRTAAREFRGTLRHTHLDELPVAP